MRERSTWIPDQIAKRAAAIGKTADDPSVLNNPEHLKEQPSAEKYLTGGPSDFAEDVAAPNWKAEYSGGETKRDEIGMPAMRPDTFNHAEKTAGQQDEESDDLLEKKADVCLKIAKRMLPKTASESMIEDQALAFMHMPDALLVETATRLAQQQDDDGQGQQQSQDKQAQQQQDDGQAQDKQAQQQQDDKGQQDKEAGQIPENFLKKKDDDKGDGDEKKQAALKLAQQACQAFQNGDAMLAQQTIQQMVQQAQGQGQSQDQIAQQVQQMIQQAMGQQQPQMSQQQQPQMSQQQQQVPQQDDQLLDQMLQVQATSALPAATASASMDIQLEGPSMDVTEVKLGSDDEALTALFASHTEVREAAQANALATGVPAPAGMARTAAVKTVGTRPNGGVSQLGGGSSAPSGGGEIDKLSDLWASAPDVKNVFGG